MLRKATITAIPIEQEHVTASEGSIEPKTDAEQMTEVLNEVSISSDTPPMLAPVRAHGFLADGGVRLD